MERVKIDIGVGAKRRISGRGQWKPAEGGGVPCRSRPQTVLLEKALHYFNSELVFSKDRETFQVYEKMALRINGQYA